MDILSKNLKYKGYDLTSVVIFEELELLYLESKVYLRIFKSSFARVERDKRIFLLNNIKSLILMPCIGLKMFIDHVITNVKWLYKTFWIKNDNPIFLKICFKNKLYFYKVFNRNEIIYCEGEAANNIHLIYSGSF